MRTPLDCPFCANSDLTVIVVDHNPPTLDVHCPECGAIGPRSVSDDPAHVLPNHDHSHCTQRYRNCLACLGLVRMNPCGASRQTHLDRNRARDVGTSQTRFQREPRHRSQVLREETSESAAGSALRIPSSAGWCAPGCSFGTRERTTCAIVVTNEIWSLPWQRPLTKAPPMPANDIAITSTKPADTHAMQRQVLGEAGKLVWDFLTLLAELRFAEANSYLAPGARMLFPGGHEFFDCTALPRRALEIYRWVAKRFERIDEFATTDEVIVYNYGTLRGAWLDGQPFDGVRYIDRFVVRDGRITDQQVWNDLCLAATARRTPNAHL